MSILPLPAPLHRFLAQFPLQSYPPLTPQRKTLTAPTLWIQPPRQPDQHLLSADVECLKWQAYLALRGLTNVHVRWDIKPEGAIAGLLPNLHVPTDKPNGDLLPAHLIPTWVDTKLENQPDELEGYISEAARDESRAWVTVLEGNIHAALILGQPSPSYFASILSISESPVPETSKNTTTPHTLQSILTPPPPPLTGFTSLIPAYGTRIQPAVIEQQYRDAIASLSDRLGTDKWFLGSTDPTALDALAFAYLHQLLHSKEWLRIEVTRRVNLVAWEWRVQSAVRGAFTSD